jgi:hypothetical protein
VHVCKMGKSVCFLYIGWLVKHLLELLLIPLGIYHFFVIGGFLYRLWVACASDRRGVYLRG